MTRLFRSKSCSLGVDSSNYAMMPPTLINPIHHRHQQQYHSLKQEEEFYDEEEEESEEEEEFEEDDDDEYDGYDDVEYSQNTYMTTMTPFGTYKNSGSNDTDKMSGDSPQSQFSVVAMVASALRKSLVTCSVAATTDDHDDDQVDIGWPTDVRHVSHVTFDRFHGFLGLPMELQPHLPPKPPSASASVFGVSAQSMHCSYDQRGNSVPTILLRMQSRLYSEGGLQAEGIFRITAENSQEEHVRNQLNRGIVPRGIDVHCLSGLIKAWFRELPSGVLDSLAPEQVMHCNTEEDCSKLIALLPPTEYALLDWAINLMADVVQNEHRNKMNARNIAMVFAPNMTQMADPLTALIHAVQVMNLLKTLIMKTMREREESTGNTLSAKSVESVEIMERSHPSVTVEITPHKQPVSDVDRSTKENASSNLLRTSTLERLECDNKDKSFSFRSNSNGGNGGKKSKSNNAGSASPPMRKKPSLGLEGFKDIEHENMETEGILNRLGLRRGIERLRQHPVFHFNKTVKKNGRGNVDN